MDIVQSFYDNMASEYDKLFFDRQAAATPAALAQRTTFMKRMI